MPPYVQVTLALVVGSFVLMAVLPTPRMPAARAGLFCFWLMAAGTVVFTVAVSMVALALFTSLPAYLVVTPAVAVSGLALTLWLTMFWLAAAPEPREAQAEREDSGEDEGGGGGGGLGPHREPPRDPGPTDGIPWDAFDRERAAWETVRPTAPADERELTGV